MKINLVHIILIFFLGIVAAQAQTIQAKVIPERDSLIIGDQLLLTLNIQAPKGVKISVPSIEMVFENQLADNPEGDFLELLEAGELLSRETTDFNVFEQAITITAWNEKIYTFPSLTFIAETNGKTDSFFSAPINIRSKFPTPVTGDSIYIADIKPAMAEPTYWTDYLWLLWILLGGLLVALVVVFVIKKIYDKQNQPIIPPTPEHWALQQLNQLLDQKGDMLHFHSGISFILRQYLGNRYNISAMELSTAEIIPQVAGCQPIKHFTKDIDEILSTADLVKFAKASALESASIFAADTLQKLVGMYIEWEEKMLAQKAHN